jgi:4-hydroxyphenylpyruvate dioxygenase
MKTSIATVSISGDLGEKLAAIAAAGFDGVEIFEADLLAFDATPREVGRMVRDAGLELTLFQPFRDFEGMPEPHRGRAFERAERKFELMGELGADLILVCSNLSPVSLGGIDRAAADLHELGERAERHGIRIGFEALAWARHINDHRDAWEVVRRADHPNVGLILDSFHSLSRKIDSNSIRSIPADRIFIVQLADAPLMDMELLQWSRHYRNMPGEGELPVIDFMRAIAATGYDGTISLEIFNDQFRQGQAKSIAADGHRSLLYLMDQVARSEPAVVMRVPAMPDRIDVHGIEFVEFASSGEEAEGLSRAFSALGFRRIGRHVSKNVVHWHQGHAEGGIHLVVNCEPDSFAHSAYAVHGTSVCAIGLKVGDANATVARATALGAELYRERVAPGELDIPAIRGVGGVVIHFLDDGAELSRVWDVEFQPVEEEDAGASPEAGLVAIDHVAQTMAYDEMLTWLLFYTSIFATRKTPMFDVVDPAGLVHSQAVENEEGSFRLTLNGAENRRTLAGRFIAETFGSAVQHLAFRTDDIFATAARLKENGFRPLEISRNYYDDLEARFGLAPEFSDRLRGEGLLYDRDEQGGEYFQLYSPLFGDGMFFEIVERRGGYGGYGAANAQFRTAAQRRHLPPRGMPKS